MPLKPGTRLGSYEITAPIGAGGMGEVYRARDTRLDRDVAVKVLPGHLTSDPQAMARFEREAKSVAALSHPNILAIHDFGTEDDVTYAVMELLEGETLRARLGKGSLGARKAVEIASQIARGLGAAHEKGIVHRDLKPENVIISPDGRAKVLDFGLAARTADSSGAVDDTQTPTRTSLTDPGTVLGSTSYMSPEQVRGQPTDPRSDIFSLGSVIYEMLTGQRAFVRETSAETMTAILKEDPRDPAAAGSDVPPGLAALVRRCMEKRPEERFHSAADVAFALEALLETSTSGAEKLLVAGTDGLARKPGWVWPSAALGLAVLAFVAGLSVVREGSIEEDLREFRLRQLTFDLAAEHGPAISPDGKSLAYMIRIDEKPRIMMQRVGGETAINLTPGPGAGGYHADFSPDGERIAYTSEEGGIFVMGATGESPRRLTDFGFHPDWSPDGKSLVVSTDIVWDPSSRRVASKLFRVDVATGDSEEIAIEGQRDAVEPSWSPGGGRIAFWGLPEMTGRRALFTAPAAGGKAVKILDDGNLNWNPVWSADGKWIYFASDRGGRRNLWRLPMDEEAGIPAGPASPVAVSTEEIGGLDVARDGSVAFTASAKTFAVVRRKLDVSPPAFSGEPERLLEGSRNIGYLEPSPDGRWVVFTSADPHEDLYLAATDGSAVRRLTHDAFKDRGATWMNDSETLVFFSDRSGRYDLWTIRMDGSDLRQLTRMTGESVTLPSVSPDGEYLVVNRRGNAHLMEMSDGTLVTESEELPEIKEGVSLFMAGWSPDGTKIVGGSQGSVGGIFTYSLSERTYSKLTNSGWNARWLPGSDYITYDDGDTMRYVHAGNLEGGILARGIDDQRVGGGLVSGNFNQAGYASGYLYWREEKSRGDIWLLSLEAASGE